MNASPDHGPAAMHQIHRPLTIICLTAILSGCVIAVDTDKWSDEHGEKWEHRQDANKAAIEAMTLGRTLDSVTAQLGEPDFRDTFQRGDEAFVVLFYRTQREKGDGRTTRDETTPLVFVDDKLVGWGPTAVEHATAAQ